MKLSLRARAQKTRVRRPRHHRFRLDAFDTVVAAAAAAAFVVVAAVVVVGVTLVVAAAQHVERSAFQIERAAAVLMAAKRRFARAFLLAGGR